MKPHYNNNNNNNKFNNILQQQQQQKLQQQQQQPQQHVNQYQFPQFMQQPQHVMMGQQQQQQQQQQMSKPLPPLVVTSPRAKQTAPQIAPSPRPPAAVDPAVLSVQQLENDNLQLAKKIASARRTLHRLKVERVVLLDRIEHIDTVDQSSLLPLKRKAEELDEYEPHSSQQQRHLLSNGQQQKQQTCTKSDSMESQQNKSSATQSKEVDVDQAAAATESSPEKAAAGAAESGGSQSVTKKRKRQKKDPNAPKKPANAFIFYAQNHREVLKQAHPEMNKAEIARELGNQWKAIAEDEKKEYYDMYEKDKVRWEQEMKVYNGDKVPTDVNTVQEDVDHEDIPDHDADGIDEQDNTLEEVDINDV
ncbi:hypothetical protein MIR68_003778 [Amoeboaphelidium protococcarum]|nr:hypothetical protein MIR68_003778 [Amoeboaphelidium protococcarum]